MLLSLRGFFTNSCLVHINYDDIFSHWLLNGSFSIILFYSILFYSILFYSIIIIISSSSSSSAVVISKIHPEYKQDSA